MFSPAVLRHTVLGAESPILVGSLHDQSGPLGTSGQPMVLSVQLAVDEINAAGGLLNRPLKIVSYDPQSNIQLYTQYAQQLALKDKVAVVHGGITSASREAIRPIFDRFKILYFYNTLYEGGVCDRDEFCLGTTPAQTVEKLVPDAMAKSGKKAYIIAADYNYGQITAKWMTKYCQDNGGTMLATEFFPLDVTNFGPTISKIQEAKPDLILSALVGGNHTAFYRQWTAAGMKSQIPIASTTFGLVNEPSTLDAKESEGIMGCLRLLRGADHPGQQGLCGQDAREIRQGHSLHQRAGLRDLRGRPHLGRGREEGGLDRPDEDHRGARDRHQLRRPERAGDDRQADPSRRSAAPISRSSRTSSGT